MRRTRTEMVRRVTQRIQLWPRRRSRPKKTWRAEIEEDAKTMGVSGCKALCRGRKEWNK